MGLPEADRMVCAPQNVVDRSGLTDSSSDSGSFSAGTDAPGGGQWDEALLPAHGYVEGQPWDMSGIPTDYSLKVPFGHDPAAGTTQCLELRYLPMACPGSGRSFFAQG